MVPLTKAEKCEGRAELDLGCRRSLGLRSGRGRRGIQMELSKGKAEMWNWNLDQQSPSKILNSPTETVEQKVWIPAGQSPVSVGGRKRDSGMHSPQEPRERDCVLVFPLPKTLLLSIQR